MNLISRRRGRGTSIQVIEPVAEQDAERETKDTLEDCRQPVREGEVQNPRAFDTQHRVVLDQQGLAREQRFIFS